MRTGVSREARGVSRKHQFAEFLLCMMLLALCAPADAQHIGKIFRIGFLDPSTASSSSVLVAAFRQELSKLGWMEGKNITIEYRFAEQESTRLPELAADLVRLNVDVIVTSGGPTPLAAKNATSTIPIVMTSSVDPVAEGLIASLARPGGNLTGLSTLAPELNTKRLEILKDVLPNLSRVGILVGGRDRLLTDLLVKELGPVATALKLRIDEIETQPDAKGLESAFQTAKQKRVGAIMVNPGRRFTAERKRIVGLAVKYQLPAIYFSKEFVDEGGLMSYGVDFDDLFRNAAHYVDRILRGTKPADLPVQQAKKSEFVINLTAAKQTGLTIPVNVLARATKVIR